MSNFLALYEFGKQLLETKDLDPVYVVLWEAKLPKKVLEKYLLAYWCFYHMGTASWIVTNGKTEPEYWQAMETAAGSKDWPRSSERRHFRGENARKSVAYLKGQGLDKLFQFTLRTDLNEERVMAIVQEWVGFGPWIAFKVADMVERLGLCKVVFSGKGMTLFDSPKEGAQLLWNEEGKPPLIYPDISYPGSWAVARILSELGTYKAPPRYERPINAQEAETILCKWKSYRNGHYEVGKDIHEVRQGLLRFGRLNFSQELLRAGKRGGLWS